MKVLRPIRRLLQPPDTLDLGSSNGGGEKCADTGYTILKPAGFSGCLNLRCEKKRKIKDG